MLRKHKLFRVEVTHSVMVLASDSKKAQERGNNYFPAYLNKYFDSSSVCPVVYYRDLRPQDRDNFPLGMNDTGVDSDIKPKTCEKLFFDGEV